MPSDARPRILICRMSAIGDAILTMPVACALRDEYPGRSHRLGRREKGGANDPSPSSARPGDRVRERLDGIASRTPHCPRRTTLSSIRRHDRLPRTNQVIVWPRGYRVLQSESDFPDTTGAKSAAF